MSKTMKSFTFAALMCLVCSLLLTAASSGLKSFHEKNILKDRHQNILRSAEIVSDTQTYTFEEIQSLYDQNIEKVKIDAEGKLLSGKDAEGMPIYLHTKNDQIQSYIIPIETRGLWGKIFGYLALENDGSTISGFTVYKHSETPGLGGEIEKKWFQDNFKGKKIVDQSGDFVSISVAKGEVKDAVPKEKQINYVDGISGATLTGKFLTAGLKETLSEYEPVSVRFRKNKIINPPQTDKGDQ